jgi:hypothetical protein
MAALALPVGINMICRSTDIDRHCIQSRGDSAPCTICKKLTQSERHLSLSQLACSSWVADHMLEIEPEHCPHVHSLEIFFYKLF